MKRHGERTQAQAYGAEEAGGQSGQAAAERAGACAAGGVAPLSQLPAAGGAEGMAELIVSSLVVAVGVLTAFALEAIAPSEVSDGEGW